jgi:hypothetical protein
VAGDQRLEDRALEVPVHRAEAPDRVPHPVSDAESMPRLSSGRGLGDLGVLPDSPCPGGGGFLPSRKGGIRKLIPVNLFVLDVDDGAELALEGRIVGNDEEGFHLFGHGSVLSMRGVADEAADGFVVKVEPAPRLKRGAVARRGRGLLLPLPGCSWAGDVARRNDDGPVQKRGAAPNPGGRGQLGDARSCRVGHTGR